MWLNYKTKLHLVEIFTEVYVSEMIQCPEFVLKYSRKKMGGGWWTDKIRLGKYCELLQPDHRFMGVHYAILSTFMYIWNIPYHNKKLNKYLFQERKAIFGSALMFIWAHFCTPVECILKFPVYYLFCMHTTGKNSFHLKNLLICFWAS